MATKSARHHPQGQANENLTLLIKPQEGMESAQGIEGHGKAIIQNMIPLRIADLYVWIECGTHIAGIFAGQT